MDYSCQAYWRIKFLIPTICFRLVLMSSNINTAKTDEKPQKRRRIEVEVKDATFFQVVREWIDALVIAFVVAMFIRTFVMELFKIPSGSMTPTLLGDVVTEGPATNRDGETLQYLLISERSGSFQVFAKRNDGYYDYEGRKSRFELSASQQLLLNKLHIEEHRILVNKFAYWFNPPNVGDVAIFRVPFKLEPETYERNGREMEPVKYDRNQSVYVKRVVATAGQQLEIRNDEHLYVNGEPVTEPKILGITKYTNPLGMPNYDVTIPEKHVAMFGDNSDNSLDSRFWGPLPEENLRGKAVLTYWPFGRKKFLTPKQ